MNEWVSELVSAWMNEYQTHNFDNYISMYISFMLSKTIYITDNYFSIYILYVWRKSRLFFQRSFKLLFAK